jgi:hypothetical protein
MTTPLRQAYAATTWESPHEGGIHEPRCLEMRLIMLSPPGAGNGAHASQLSQTTGVAYISSGALPRAVPDVISETSGTPSPSAV